MKICIDADGCPVVDITVRTAKSYGIETIILCDTAHRIERENVRTIIVDKGADSVDIRLVNLLEKGDIAITQDYGLAAMCLGRDAIALDQNGREYTSENISGLLEFRAISKKIRRSGGHLKGGHKRTREQDADFERSLKAVIERSIKNNN